MKNPLQKIMKTPNKIFILYILVKVCYTASLGVEVYRGYRALEKIKSLSKLLAMFTKTTHKTTPQWGLPPLVQ